MSHLPTLKFRDLFLVLIPVVFLLTSCGGGGSGVATLTFQLDGPCEECPPKLVDSLIGTIPNLVSHKVENNQVVVEFDTMKLKRSEFIISLNKLGFNYDTDLADDDTTPDLYCCKKPEDPDDVMSGLDDDDPLDVGNEAELDIELDSPQEQENLDEELDDALMIDEEDLELEEPKPKKKKK
jgi:hypothetical protein